MRAITFFTIIKNPREENSPISLPACNADALADTSKSI